MNNFTFFLLVLLMLFAGRLLAQDKTGNAKFLSGK